MGRVATALILALVCSSAASAENVAVLQIGTPEQRREAIAACGPDARLYCRSLKEADGPYAYSTCLEMNRSRLTPRCVGLLARYLQ
jgi:hypothetical protein